MSNATARRNSNIRRAAQRSDKSHQDAIERIDLRIDALDARQDTLDARIDAQELVIDDLKNRIEVLEGG